jgi:Predicted permease, DMT superfamily
MHLIDGRGKLATIMPAQPTLISSPSLKTSATSMYLRLVLVALFWGGTFVAGRAVAGSTPGILAATIRFGIAAPLLLLVAWRFEGGLPRLNVRQALLTFGLGLTGIFLYNLCFFGALGELPAGRSALFVAFNPIVTALLLSVLMRERLTPMKWLGIGTAFIGAAIIVTRGDVLGAIQDISQSVGMGELLMLAAITGWAFYTLIGRQAMATISPIAATTYAALWGLALLTITSVFQTDASDWAALSWTELGCIAYLGIFGTVIGFIWYYQGVKQLGAAQAAVFNNLVPVFGIGLGALALSEPILISMVVGGVLVILGVGLTNRA